MSRRAEILSRVHTLPAMPAAAAKIVALVQDPETSIEKVTRAVELDPGLTSNILRLANSAYFGGLRSVHSLREAVVRLGINHVFDLVVALAVVRLEHHVVKGYDLPAGALWEHSVAVAAGSAELARSLGRKVPGAVFTAGLLHDIGKVVLSTFLVVDAGPIMSYAFEDQVSFEQAERRVLGIDHAEVGAAVLESWNLPQAIVNAVRYHHEPNAFPGDHFVADLVHVADALAMLGGIGVGNDGLNYRPSRDALLRLNMTTSLAEAVTCRMLGAIEEARDLFAD